MDEDVLRDWELRRGETNTRTNARANAGPEGCFEGWLLQNALRAQFDSERHRVRGLDVMREGETNGEERKQNGCE